MTFQVQRIGNSYGVLFTEEQVRSAGLHGGMQVEVRLDSSEKPRLREAAEVTEDPHYANHEEVIAAFERTEARYANVYRELAK